MTNCAVPIMADTRLPVINNNWNVKSRSSLIYIRVRSLGRNNNIASLLLVYKRGETVGQVRRLPIGAKNKSVVMC